MKNLVIIFVAFLLASCASSVVVETPKTDVILDSKYTDEILAVSYELEVFYTNGDVDTLDVEFYVKESELHLVGLDLKQNEGVSYISCDLCNDEYFRKVEAVVADVRRYNVLDYSFYSPE